MARVVIVVLLSLVVLGACGPVPRPFQSAQKADNTLLRLGDRGGVFVAPVAGEEPGEAGRFAEAVAAHLRRLNIPATTSGANGESRLLYTRARYRLLPGGARELTLSWELRDPNGRRIGERTLRRAAAGTRTRAGALADDLAGHVAREVAVMVQDPPVQWAAIPGFPRARLVVLPPDDGPGDSARSLPRALRAELLAAKLPVAEEIGEDDLLVLVDVALGLPKGGRQDVAVKWVVVEARDDKDLGEVAQRSSVSAGSLDGPWGQIARDIARGAVGGVIDVLNRAAIESRDMARSTAPSS